MARSLEIICTGCGDRSLVRAEPVFEGFRKAGEAFICLNCGHRYESEVVTPFAKRDAGPDVFSAAEREAPKLSIFAEDELHKSCRWCKHFIISAFDQKCGVTLQQTEATDLCLKFESKENPGEADA